MKHWRTTVGGYASGMGLVLLGIQVLREPTFVTPVSIVWCGRIGLLLVACGVTFLGHHAADKKVVEK